MNGIACRSYFQAQAVARPVWSEKLGIIALEQNLTSTLAQPIRWLMYLMHLSPELY